MTVFQRIAQAFARFKPAPIVIEPIPKGTVTMSTVTTIAEIIAEAPDFLKVASDLLVVEQAFQTSGVSAGLTALFACEADVVKVYNDIKALGAAEVTAGAPSALGAPNLPSAGFAAIQSANSAASTAMI